MRKIVVHILLAFTISSGYNVLGQAKDSTQNITSDSLLLQKEQFIQVNKIHIVGNDKTQRSIIMREMSVLEDEVVPGTELDQLVTSSRNNVYNTNLFSTVEIQQLPLDSTRVDLLIKVRERWYLYPIPVFKLTDRNFNDWWVNRDADLSRVKYGLRLHKYNFRGRNERLKLVALTGFENQFEAGYRIPYIEKTQRHGLAFNVGYTEHNNIAYQTEDHLPTFFEEARTTKRDYFASNIVHTYRGSFYNYLITTLTYFNTNIIDTVAMLNPNFYGDGRTNQRAFKMTMVFNRDTRDNRNYALKGDQLFFEADKVGFGIFDDVNLFRFTGYYGKNIDLGKKFYASHSFAGMVSTKDVPYYNYVGFGYVNYLVRGYELDVVEGYQSALSKNTLRRQLFKGQTDISRVMPIKGFQKVPYAVYAKAFADAGWINNYEGYEQSSRLTNRLLYGVGVGVDVVTMYDFVMRVEYSYNAENNFNLFVNFQAEL